MKLTALVILLVTAGGHGQPAGEGRLRKCNFVKYLGSGNGLTASGLADFTVVAGAKVHCHTTCSSGGETTLAYNFGSVPAASGNTDGETDSDCGMTTKFKADSDQTSLGWSVTTAAEYNDLVLTCYCTDDGTGLTIDGVKDTIDDAEDVIKDVIDEVEDAIDEAEEALDELIENDFDFDSVGCFSESATVQVQGRGDVSMKELQLNDRVLTAANKYQPVYSFGHRKPDVEMEFYHIYTEGFDRPIEMTGNHMIMRVDQQGHVHAVRADSLQEGDRLLHVESEKEITVTRIQTDRKKGLYMPLTPNGQVVVNGLLASNYISISDEAPGVVAHSNWFFTYLAMPEQALTHWWLSPFRMLCMGVSSGFCSMGDEEATSRLKDDQENGILPWLLTGRKLAAVVEVQHNFVQMILFGFPTFVIFGFFNFIETILFGASFAPATLVLIVALAVAKKMKNRNDIHVEDDELNEKLLVENV